MSKKETAEEEPIAKAIKMPYVFGSSTPREFSYMDNIPAKYRIYNVKMRSERRSREEPSLRDFMREIRNPSPTRRLRDRSVDNAARIFVFGSSTPREMSYLERVPHEFRIYDVKLSSMNDKRSKTTTFVGSSSSSAGGRMNIRRTSSLSSTLDSSLKVERASPIMATATTTTTTTQKKRRMVPTTNDNLKPKARNDRTRSVPASIRQNVTQSIDAQKRTSRRQTTPPSKEIDVKQIEPDKKATSTTAAAVNNVKHTKREAKKPNKKAGKKESVPLSNNTVANTAKEVKEKKPSTALCPEIPSAASPEVTPTKHEAPSPEVPSSNHEAVVEKILSYESNTENSAQSLQPEEDLEEDQKISELKAEIFARMNNELAMQEKLPSNFIPEMQSPDREELPGHFIEPNAEICTPPPSRQGLESDQNLSELNAEIVAPDTVFTVHNQLDNIGTNDVHGKTSHEEYNEVNIHRNDEKLDDMVRSDSVESFQREKISSVISQLENQVIETEDNEQFILDETNVERSEYGSYDQQQFDESDIPSENKEKRNSIEDDDEREVASVTSAVGITYTSPENIEFATEQKLNDSNEEKEEREHDEDFDQNQEELNESVINETRDSFEHTDDDDRHNSMENPVGENPIGTIVEPEIRNADTKNVEMEAKNKNHSSSSSSAESQEENQDLHNVHFLANEIVQDYYNHPHEPFQTEVGGINQEADHSYKYRVEEEQEQSDSSQQEETKDTQNSVSKTSLETKDQQISNTDNIPQEDHESEYSSQKHVVIQPTATIMPSLDSEDNVDGDLEEKDEAMDLEIDDEKSTVDAREEFHFHSGEENRTDEDQSRTKKGTSLDPAGTVVNTSLQPDVAHDSHHRSLTPYYAPTSISETVDQDTESDFYRPISVASEKGETVAQDESNEEHESQSQIHVENLQKDQSNEEHDQEIKADEEVYSPDFKNTILAAFDCQNVNPTLQDIFHLPEKNYPKVQSVIIDGSGSFHPPEMHLAASDDDNQQIDGEEIEITHKTVSNIESLPQSSLGAENKINELNQSSDGNIIGLLEEEKGSIPIVVQYASEEIASDKSSDDEKGHSNDEKGFESDDERDDSSKHNERHRITPPHDECRFVEDVGSPSEKSIGSSVQDTENDVQETFNESRSSEYEQSVVPLNSAVQEVFSTMTIEREGEKNDDNILITTGHRKYSDQNKIGHEVSFNRYDYDGADFSFNKISKFDGGLDTNYIEMSDRKHVQTPEEHHTVKPNERIDDRDLDITSQDILESAAELETRSPTEYDKKVTDSADDNQDAISQSLYDKFGAVANEFVDSVFSSVEQRAAMEEIVQEIQKLNSSSGIESLQSNVNSANLYEKQAGNGHKDHSTSEEIDDFKNSGQNNYHGTYSNLKELPEHVEEEEQLVLTPYLHSQNETTLHRLQNQTDLTEELHIGIPEYESPSEASLPPKDVSDSNSSSLSSNEDADKGTAREITSYVYSNSQFQMHMEPRSFVQSNNSDEDV